MRTWAPWGFSTNHTLPRGLPMLKQTRSTWPTICRRLFFFNDKFNRHPWKTFSMTNSPFTYEKYLVWIPFGFNVYFTNTQPIITVRANTWWNYSKRPYIDKFTLFDEISWQTSLKGFGRVLKTHGIRKLA